MSKNQKNQWKSIEIANIEREGLDIFWTTWGISMKFSAKMWLMIILSHKKPGLQTLFRRYIFGKMTGVLMILADVLQLSA